MKYDKEEKGKRIDNIPDTGTLTGYYFNDLHGTWYEYIQDKGKEKAYIIGEPKE